MKRQFQSIKEAAMGCEDWTAWRLRHCC